MTRENITQSTVLDTLLAQLRTTLTLNERQCFLCINPLGIELPPGGERYVTLSPGDGDFPFEETHEDQCYEDGTIVVTGYVRMAFDNKGREHEFLQHATRGVLKLKRDLLRVLTNVDLQDDQGNTFLRETIRPIKSRAPDYDPAKKIGWLQLIIPAGFDWDLSE